jgi:thiol:disulfide interchange protein DsbC
MYSEAVMTKVKVVGISAALMLMGFITSAAADDGVQQVKKTLQTLMPNAKADSIRMSPLPGIYEVVYGSQVIYMSKDGRYMIEGDVYDVEQRVNLTENVRQDGRKEALATLDEKNMIVFKPEDGETKYVITAFTDIDCGYCRKLHSQIKEYNDLGIEVHYAAFPRSGLKTPSYYKAVSVWCAKDRNKAMTFAKGGAKLDQLKQLAQVDNTKPCTDAIARQLGTARDVGVTGTPSLFMENGRMIPGYVPPKRLRKMLDDAATHG